MTTPEIGSNTDTLIWNKPLQTATIHCIKTALEEDIQQGDISAALIPPNTQAHARIITREPGVVCGIDCAQQVFHTVDSSLLIHQYVNDGDSVAPNQCLIEITGSARSLLTAERTALNFLQCLSATSTITAQLVQAIQHTSCRILDTRKTLPGLRLLQKYAVHCGGGDNHRLGLFDAFLLKENHIAAHGSIKQLAHAARKQHPHHLLQIEVETLEELQEAIDAGVDRIMLDNFSVSMAKQAVSLTQGRIPLEISGNIQADTLVAYAETGVDYISIGALTKHIQALDLSMRLTINE
ncbi:MAG: nicotinate-nucleotide diphosphorylase (carboxylating) [Legionellales bacterium]|nr:nicotinate-nucleotide diphosphorylase (carboxylating) [Legionellales bacterium]HAG62287.1 carboxylating nicotinate-nucleotide diphosphorylase [Coxiellaceae bacterium]|tara:strand:- start:576 stop:1460 length:885 start_codon:yes stop_codon:yes gene_type:complete